MASNINQIVNEYTNIFTQLKRKLTWKVADSRSLMLVSSLYVMKEKPFDFDRFITISDYIKKNVGLFSTLRSAQRYTTAAMLDIRYDQPKKQFQEYLDVYEQLIKGGFRRGPFTYIAALSLLEVDPSKREQLIERSMAVYKAMKKDHYFLTGESDYPLALHLARGEELIEDLMNKIGYLYKKLNQEGFRKGNDLKLMSHILSLQSDVDRDVIIDRVIRLRDDFTRAGRKVKPLFYPVIGVLSILEDCSKQVDAVLELYQRLNGEKAFKWNKDLNFILAVNFIVKDKIEDGDFISTGLQTTIESIIQAQQAAMIAAVAGGAAATAGANN